MRFLLPLLVRPLLFVALLVGSLGVAETAAATSVRWSAPDDCPKDEFVFTLEQTLEQSIDDVAGVDISVEIDGARKAWRVEVTLGSRSEGGTLATRILAGTSCADVSRAAAVAVAMALHARNRVQEAPAAEGFDEPAIPEPPRGEPQQAEARIQAAHESSSDGVWSVPLGAGFVLDGALLGELAWGYSLGLAVGWRAWELGAAGVVLPEIVHATRDGLALNLDALIAAIVLCRRVGGPSLNPRLCLGYEFGSVHGEGTGTGLSATYSRRASWHAVRADLGVELSLDENFSLLLTAGPALSFTEAQFVFDDGPVAHRLPRFSGRGAAMVRWVF